MYREKPRLEDGSKDPTDRASPQWNKESWKELPKLKILSLDARLFPGILSFFLLVYSKSKFI